MGSNPVSKITQPEGVPPSDLQTGLNEFTKGQQNLYAATDFTNKGTGTSTNAVMAGPIASEAGFGENQGLLSIANSQALQNFANAQAAGLAKGAGGILSAVGKLFPTG